VQADICKEADVESLFKKIHQTGHLDVLVANAGYLPDVATIEASESSEWWKGFEINVFGTYLLAKHFVKQATLGKSSPVFIGVNTGAAHLGPMAGPMSSYVASKLAAAQVVQFLQSENPAIKAFNVSPGIVESDMSTKANMPHLPAQDSPLLMAHLAVWLAGPDSEFLKGKFLWANWDIETLVKEKEKINANPALFTLALEGWNDGFAALKA
jgi:NAD(P)-dependent dehydrogenase (short-subunit alcohol dehydrogenase family)